MKTYFNCLLFLLTVCYLPPAFTQNAFEIVMERDSMEMVFYTFETNSSTYVSIGNIFNKLPSPENKNSPIVIRYTDTTDINLYIFPKEDTTYSFERGFQKENGNFLLIGGLNLDFSKSLPNSIYLCELSTEMEIVWEKVYPTPVGYECKIADFVIDQDSNIVVSVSMKLPTSSSDYLFLAKFDMDGNMINSKFDTVYESGQYNDMVVKPDGTGYYIFGNITKDGGFMRNWLDIDIDLNVIESGGPMGGENYLRSPITAKWLPNGNLLFVNNEGQETPNTSHDMEVRVSDPDFNTVSTEVFFDEDKIYNPVYKGMDFVYDDLIWTCTFNYDFPHFSGTEVFKVYLFDSEMNLKGMKVYGGDSRWWFFHLLATTDGGCIISGMIREPGAEEYTDMDVYIKKMMPGDILTSAEETEMENDMDAAVFPNPFTDCLIVETARRNLVFSVFDNRGQKVLGSKINNIPKTNFDAGHLTPGFYFYTITEKGRTIQSGKLLKQ